MSLLSETVPDQGPVTPHLLQAIHRRWPDSRYCPQRHSNVYEARSLIVAGVNPAHIYDESLPDDWLHEGSALDPAGHRGTTVIYSRYGMTVQERAAAHAAMAERVETYDTDNECKHRKLPTDRNITCSCWDVPRLPTSPAIPTREAA